MEVFSALLLVITIIAFGLFLKSLSKAKTSKKAMAIRDKYQRILAIVLTAFLITAFLSIPEIKAKQARAIKEIKAKEILSRVEIKEVKVTEDIPFETETKDDLKLSKGRTQTRQEGQLGKKEKKYKIIYLNGKEERRELLSENVVKQPVKKVVSRGTYVAVPTVKKVPAKKYNKKRSRND